MLFLKIKKAFGRALAEGRAANPGLGSSLGPASSTAPITQMHNQGLAESFRLEKPSETIESNGNAALP